VKAADNFEALQAAETEVSAHMEAVIERAKDVDGWDIDDVLRKVNASVGKILDDHEIVDATKEKAMNHFNDRLSTMLEEISADKEFKLVVDSEAMKAAEVEVAAHMDGVIKAVKAKHGWNTKEVVGEVDAHVNKVLDAHGIVETQKERAMDHFNNKLSKMLDEISAEQDWGFDDVDNSVQFDGFHFDIPDTTVTDVVDNEGYDYELLNSTTIFDDTPTTSNENKDWLRKDKDWLRKFGFNTTWTTIFDDFPAN